MKIEASDDDKLMVEKEMIEEEIMNRLLEIENKMQWIPQHCLFDCKQFIDLQSKTSKANNPNEWGEERLKQFEYIIINSRCNQFVANNIKKKKKIFIQCFNHNSINTIPTIIIIMMVMMIIIMMILMTMIECESLYWDFNTII